MTTTEPTLLDWKTYEGWLIAADYDPANVSDPLTATLLAHVVALLERIDNLMDPDEHDERHGRDCRCWLTQCACAYDYPTARCTFHPPLPSVADEAAETTEGDHPMPLTTADGEICGNRYNPQPRPGDRIVHCQLDVGHDGDHEETDTGNTWPNVPAPTIAPITVYELIRKFDAVAKAHGWDIEWDHREGEGITESASYHAYMDSIAGIEEHGR